MLSLRPEAETFGTKPKVEIYSFPFSSSLLCAQLSALERFPVEQSCILIHFKSLRQSLFVKSVSTCET